VNVDASLRLIDVSGDPSKQGVRDRWNAYREGRDLPKLSPAEVPAPARSGVSEPSSSAYHLARTENEQVAVQLRRIELGKAQGRIVEAGPTMKAVHDTHAAARAAVLQLPDRLAQILAPESDPLKVHELLRLECERVCEVMISEIQRLREQANVEVTA
jgi:hypothetical protein